MSTGTTRTAAGAATDYSALLRRATEKIAALRARLDEAEERHRVPVAVVGMACRFPGGADSPDAYWQLLKDGVDAVTGLPDERRRPVSEHLADPAAPHTRQGSYLRGVDRFDADFFGIAEKDATAMDPQQRLLTEVAWEALEHAGLPAESLRATRTGVFMGVTGSDYWQLRLRERGLGPLDAATGTGNAASFAVGRISHLLGLQGPCMALDTGCSSAMVGIHLAVRSLRTGESDTALVGAAHLMLGAEGTETLADLGVLSARGKCRTFDAGADGFAVGEGCGVVVLKRLPDALRDGDRVLAVVRGSATNHNGASGALGIPNGSAQRTVLRQAYADAAVAPASVGYVEAHGTGTPLGDAIELQALVDELMPGRSDDLPLVVGTGKTNIGHLETASGMAALIKAVLCLQHGVIPAHLHYSEPHPQLVRAAEQVVIPTRALDWPAGERAPRLAGVSSFSANGTNVHVVLAEAPPRPVAAAEPVPEPGGQVLLPLSARDPEALRTLAARVAALLEEGAPLADVAGTAARRRSHLEHRLTVSAGTAKEAAYLLRGAAEGAPESASVAVGRHASGRRTVVFSYGSGDAEDLLGLLTTAGPGLATAVGALEPVVAEATGTSLRALLAGTERLPTDPARLRATTRALQLALTAWWRSLGITPGAVVAVGEGQWAAAEAAGRLSPEQALGGRDFAAYADQGSGSVPLHLCGDATEGDTVAAALLAGGRRVLLDTADASVALPAALGRLHCHGVPVEWDRVHPDARFTDLPTYPWQHRSYWWRGTP